MNKFRGWLDRKAKEFINKHVVIPINMSMVESHHERLSDMGQYQNRLNSKIVELRSGYLNLFDMIMGHDKDLGTGGIVHIEGLMEVVRKQDAKIKALEESLEQFNRFMVGLPKLDDFASKNALNDAINAITNDLDVVREQTRYSGIRENYEVAQEGVDSDD